MSESMTKEQWRREAGTALYSLPIMMVLIVAMAELTHQSGMPNWTSTLLLVLLIPYGLIWLGIRRKVKAFDASEPPPS